MNRCWCWPVADWLERNDIGFLFLGVYVTTTYQRLGHDKIVIIVQDNTISFCVSYPGSEDSEKSVTSSVSVRIHNAQTKGKQQKAMAKLSLLLRCQHC